VASNILEPASFRPVLSPAYNPGPNSSCAAPLVIIDGGANQADLCREKIRELATDGQFKRDFQLSATPRWFALVVNCRGVLSDGELDIIPREENSSVAGYEPVVIKDENSLLGKRDTLAAEFQ
jgi:hypothetical protein